MPEPTPTPPRPIRAGAVFSTPARIAGLACLAGLAIVAGLATLTTAPDARADEGMWPVNRFPAARFEKEYGFAPTQEWLDHLRLAAVRFNSGGSGSFVSADGLAITNHHVGADCIAKVSSAEHDYMKDGFIAATPADEVPCPDLELNVLVSIEPVTERVLAAVAAVSSSAGDPAAAGAARRGELSRIEKECADATELRCDVVTLYEGGAYDLYRYRRYTDVRLVFAPESQLANFGGDPDNFNFPRYAIDFALFRLWEDGKPAATPEHLRFNPEGLAEGEVAFLAGNPGATSRFDTVAQLEAQRDLVFPFLLMRFDQRRTAAVDFAARGGEEARIAEDDILGLENSLKAFSGYLSGLLDPDLMERKRREEAELRQAVAGDPALSARVGDPWSEIATAMETDRAIFARSLALEGLGGRGAPRLARIARDIVRLAAERERPNAERLREYRETAMPSLLQRLYSEAPVYLDYEEYELAQALRDLRLQYGPVHPLVVQVFGDRTPDQLAAELIAGTKLADVAERRRLVEGGAEAVAASDDALIRLARALDPAAREIRKIDDDQIESVEDGAGERIARAFFAVHGEDTYPDATFTLRVTYGRAIGYEEGGKQIPWFTTFAGYYERSAKHGGTPPYDLPAGLVAAKDRIDLSAPVDFTSTHDIIGGNSGSPLVDRDGTFVGIVFDGNLYMLPNRYVYSQKRSRSISVHPQAILQTLTKVYPGAAHLAEELIAGKRGG